MLKKNILFFFMFFILAFNALAEEVPFTIADRDRLIRVEAKLEEIDKRFEQIDKRFEQIDKRFEELRMDINKRFDQMMTFMWMLVAIFVGITATTIGFAIWDRRTMIRPFEVKVRALEETDKKLIEVLRKLAKEDKRLAEILRSFGLF